MEDECEQIKVLLIEDNPSYADLIHEYLTQTSGCFVSFVLEFAFNLSDGLSSLAKHPPDVVLLDLLLPGCRDIDSLKQVHQKAPDLPIVVLTGMDDDALAQKAIRQGAQDYLVKTRVNSSVIPRVLLYAIERKRYEEKLRQAQKMEAIGRLASGISHDLRNLVTAILRYADLILEKVESDETLRSHVEEIKKAGVSASELTRQLLAFSRKHIVEPKVMDLNTVLTEMEKLLCRVIGEDIKLVTNLEQDRCFLKIDPTYMEQIVMNLAANARDAMPEGGRMTIKTVNVDLDKSCGEGDRILGPGRYVMLSASDTGHGIDPETQKRIFEPFFTTKGINRGTGLGLATVYGIVKQSNGMIEVDSELGKGTTFKIYFPRVEEEPEHVLEGLKEIAGALQGSETVLVVEDEDAVRNLVSRVLQKEGYTVLTASHGDEALHIAGEYQGNIHLLLTDSVMPEMSGRKLAERLVAKRGTMKVVYMSGYTEKGIDRHDTQDAEVAFLQKPFTPDVLLRKVREQLHAN